MTEREKTALKALHERAERSGKRAKIYENYAAKELARALFPLYSADSDEEAFSEAFRDAVSSCGVRNPFLAALAVAKIFEEKRTPLFYSEELHFTRPERKLLKKAVFPENSTTPRTSRNAVKPLPTGRKPAVSCPFRTATVSPCRGLPGWFRKTD